MARYRPRTLTDSMDIFTCEPCNDLLSNRKENRAYATADLGSEYAMYFPDRGSVAIASCAQVERHVLNPWKQEAIR